MSARFTEPCRSEPLKLGDAEQPIAIRNQRRPSQKEVLTCQQDIFIGVFFDGTGNNKYRDTTGFSHSNVARLYEAYSGLAFSDMPSLGKGGKPVGDLPTAWPQGLSADEKRYYRKFYVPGLGTPFPEIGDAWAIDQALGAGFGAYGDERLDWALLQLANHVHAALLGGSPLQPVLGEKRLIKQMQLDTGFGLPARVLVLEHRNKQLREKIESRLKQKPCIRSVRLSVFGFSRGAALARTFCNRVAQGYQGQIGGIRLEIDFLGIFDTVASVGLPNSMPLGDGEMSWADKPNLVVKGVRRCVHLVAAHEVRGSFPLTSTGSAGNVKEVVYPGSHSDVGGGYAPNDQGRSIGKGAEGDALKLSQIPLAQMYREALIAGVPLVPADSMPAPLMKHFRISQQTIAAFNAYVAATCQGEGKPDKGMWLTETQPVHPLKTIMRQQYGFYLRWRKQMQGKVHLLPGLTQSHDAVYKQRQDTHDIKTVDEQLRLELKIIQDESDDWAKSDKYKDWVDGVGKEWNDKRPVTTAESSFFAALVHDSRAGFTPTTNLNRDSDSLGKGQAPSYHRHAISQHELAIRTLKHYRNDPSLSSQRQRVDERIAEEEQALADLKSNKKVIVISGGHESYEDWGYLRWRVIL